MSKYIVIRNKKSDALTMHASSCSVVVKHFNDAKDPVDFINRASSDTQAEALEAVEFHGGKTKICKCAKL